MQQQQHPTISHYMTAILGRLLLWQDWLDYRVTMMKSQSSGWDSIGKQLNVAANVAACSNATRGCITTSYERMDKWSHEPSSNSVYNECRALCTHYCSAMISHMKQHSPPTHTNPKDSRSSTENKQQSSSSGFRPGRSWEMKSHEASAYCVSRLENYNTRHALRSTLWDLK